ncbi:hypothetical protein SERLA73DRAFT_124994 [Serpula lacrymans var. lacrymans S7.3]|uniref:Large ribosomal subunit protein mL46 n=1 Tax=Serpula lacrymans var. lacrymans (strain S7.3) TaxID=936435 RepID=F8Q6B7_SERL3|nr:hypothetical protein SERLA73DRAFT_124994 [Serpula lacrymans var. lacrymans S7.3]
MFSRTVLSPCNRPPKEFSETTSRPIKPSRPIVNAAVILNRSPIITRTPTPFERAYYAYQSRIHRALHNPFPYEFYFKQGSPLEARFNIEERRRERKAFGAPFGMDTAEQSESATLAEASLRDEDEETMPRVHEADTKQDLKSLDRRGQRNLYLMLLKNESGKDVWRFPQGGVEKGELLHQAANRDLEAECGSHMDTWIVSRNPIGVYHPSSVAEPSSKAVVFFYKAHIMAGQARPDPKRVLDFAWLTKGGDI